MCSILKVTYEVLKKLQEGLIKSYYKDPVHRYLRVTRTIELIRRNYEFKNIKNKVDDFIKKCAKC